MQNQLMAKIIKNTSIYAIGNILPKAAGFFLLPVYTRYLTPADYGIVSSMQVLSTILAVAFTLAIERSIYRLYWDYKTDNDKNVRDNAIDAIGKIGGEEARRQTLKVRIDTVRENASSRYSLYKSFGVCDVCGSRIKPEQAFLIPNVFFRP